MSKKGHTHDCCQDLDYVTIIKPFVSRSSQKYPCKRQDLHGVLNQMSFFHMDGLAHVRPDYVFCNQIRALKSESNPIHVKK